MPTNYRVRPLQDGWGYTCPLCFVVEFIQPIKSVAIRRVAPNLTPPPDR